MLDPPKEDKRQMLLERLAESFMDPGGAGIDWDALRDGKLRAWPLTTTEPSQSAVVATRVKPTSSCSAS